MVNNMRYRLGKAALVAAVAGFATLGVVGNVHAQTTASERKVEHLTLRDANMVEALRALTAQTGVQFIIEPSDQPYTRVTLQLSDVTVEDALKYICEAGGGFYRLDEGGVYIISHHKPEEAKPVVAEPTPKKSVVMKKILLLHAAPRDVYERLTMTDPIAAGGQIFDTRIWDRMKDITKHDSKVIGGTYVQNSPFQMSIASGNSAVPQSKTGLDTAGSQIQLPGETANQFGLGGGGAGGGIGGGQNGGGIGGGLGGGQNGGGGLGGGLGGQNGGIQLTPGQGYVPQGIEHVSFDPTDNSLIVQGTDDAIDELRKAVEFFDTVPQQVTVKVEFIASTTSLAKEIGYDWLYSRGTLVTGNTPGTLANTGDPFFMNFVSGNVATSMRTTLTTQHGKLVNAPILRTLNNQPATIAEDEQVNVLIDQIVSTNGGQVITAPELYPIDITTQLSLAPRINRDGTVTVYINTQYADIASVTQNPDGGSIPNVDTQFIQVVARVKSGETIALGGLVHKNDQTAVEKYPILGDLPIIGQFFRKTTISNDDTELLIFVTPTIIEDDAGSSGQGI